MRKVRITPRTTHFNFHPLDFPGSTSRATLNIIPQGQHLAPVATRTRHRTPQRCHPMGSLLPWQGHHDLTVEKILISVKLIFIFTCTQYWIIPCL